MAHIHGKSGEVNDGSAVTGARNWSLTYSDDVVETTDFGDSGAKTYIAGLTGWSGTYEVVKDGAPPHAMSATVSFTLKESQTANQNWVGSGIINSIGVTTSVDGVVVYSYGFQGTGALTVPTA